MSRSGKSGPEMTNEKLELIAADGGANSGEIPHDRIIRQLCGVPAPLARLPRRTVEGILPSTEHVRGPVLTRENLVQSVVKSLDVLELIGGSHDGLPVQLVARSLNLPRSTAHSLLKTLAHKGYLERADKPIRYRLGDALGALRRRDSDREILARAAPRLLHIARRTECETILGEYIGGEILGVLRVPPGEPKMVTMPMTWNLSAYGSGLVFQAFLPAGAVREFRLRHPLSRDDRLRWPSMGTVDECLARIRADGFLRLDKDGTYRVAAPVFGAGREIRASVIALLPGGLANPQRKMVAVRMVRRAAGELSSLLPA
jgi:DNA-binding IclR family transcriptional regulator